MGQTSRAYHNTVEAIESAVRCAEQGNLNEAFINLAYGISQLAAQIEELRSEKHEKKRDDIYFYIDPDTGDLWASDDRLDIFLSTSPDLPVDEDEDEPDWAVVSPVFKSVGLVSNRGTFDMECTAMFDRSEQPEKIQKMNLPQLKKYLTEKFEEFGWKVLDWK